MTGWRHVYRWDLDKTYLETHFESLSRLVRIAFERPEEKVNVPGSAALLRELSRPREGVDPSRVCIVSGSPTQMRKVLEQKLKLDGVTWHEFHLKPQWDNLRRGRFKAVRDQVGYKLPLLLESRASVGPGTGETLFGDDAEADGFIYSLYADILAGKLDVPQLIRLLKAAGAYPDAIDRCVAAAEVLEKADDVERIFIMLDQRSPPSTFRPYGARVVPIFNYFQAALVLFAGGHLDADAVIGITRAFLEEDQHPVDELANCFQDVVRRGHLPGSAMQELGLAVQESLGATGEREVIWNCVQRFTDLGAARHYRKPEGPAPAEYLGLLDAIKRRG
jgi:hypothetical protein